jgi:general stress protein 26
MKEKVLEFMAASDHCVISTCGPENKPQSAFVGFSEDGNLELVIGTNKKSRKYQNLANNPYISIVIADRDKRLEIQYEGQAKAMTAEELGERLNLHFKKIPVAEKRLSDSDQAWIKILPVWIRYVDANFSPMKFEEMWEFV